MTNRKLGFVSFEPINDEFRGYLSMGVVLGSDEEPEILLQKSIKIYENTLKKMASIISEIKN
ncbi:hypothetical protein KA005_22255, partial [bacterium]|nr:hypothetical protein [bacterium]